ncbi:MAG: cardiolipin synthase B [Candidatus Wallbacteria bacterium]|nr:cardiolipin synthase B [Candidatus Wallbacteria bacterium]
MLSPHPTPEPLQLARRPAQVGANRLTLYCGASEAYLAMLEAIECAQERVLLEMYIFRDDAMGQQFGKALTTAAARGADVRVLADWFGSIHTSSGFFERLRAGGVRVEFFNPMSLWRKQFVWPLRDHRKILVCDGTVAFSGSLNIGAEYCGYDGGSGWLEVQLRIEGPGAAQLESLFEETWEIAASGRPWYRPPPPQEALRRWVRSRERRTAAKSWVEAGQLQILRSGTWRDRRDISRVYEALLKRAQHRVSIMNPYFLPGRRFLRALRAACRRGVQVRLMLTANTDFPPIWYAGRNLFKRLLDWGAEIWLWQGAHLHSKVVVVDDSWAAIGSYNFDNFSLFRNLEVVVAVSNRTLAGALEWTFEKEKALCTPVHREEWKRRGIGQKFLERMAYLFRYWL